MVDPTRRSFVQGAAGAAAFAAAPVWAQSRKRIRFGLTPVFLDNDAEVLEALSRALFDAIGLHVEFEQRRTYEEVTGLLLQGSIDAAWLCGFPYLQHREELSVIAVPVWRGAPRYQSYLIARPDDPARSLAELRGGVHAFSDPDSNSGFLVTATDIIRMGERPESFFRRTIFTYGHRNVVRAVADGLTRSGSVDGYVWEVLAEREPALASRTRVVAKSEWFGFPPICARKDHVADPRVISLRNALLGLAGSELGRQALSLLQLDGMAISQPGLFAGIAARMKDLA